jgi:hypothetical protein
VSTRSRSALAPKLIILALFVAAITVILRDPTGAAASVDATILFLKNLVTRITEFVQGFQSTARAS